MIQRIASCFTGKISKWVTVAVWILIALILTLTLPSVGDKVKNNADNLPSNAQSVLADQVIQEYFPNSTGVPALLVWHREAGLTEEDFSIVRQLTEELTNSPLVAQEAIIPLHMGIPIEVLTSDDGSTLILPITFTYETETEILKDNLVQMREFINEQAGANIFEADLTDGLSARFTGPVGISVDATDLFLDADIVLLIATVLLVLVLLLLIYRSPILAIIPLVGVGFAYLVTSPILGWLAGNGWITVDSQAISIMTVLLFGAGTDYCLFLITRYRDDLKHEKNPRTALIHAFQNASGAIAMSGFTVVMALLALLFAQYGSSHRFAIPFSLSILIMGIASLTLVPAILAILGRASFYPFIPRTAEMEQERAIKRNKPVKKLKTEHRLWSRIGTFVTEKPWLVISVTMVVLIVLALFSTQTKYKYDLLSSFPAEMESREGFTIIGQTYTPGELAPITVIVRNNADMDTIVNKVTMNELVNNVSDVVVSEVDSTYSSFEIVLDIDPYSTEAMAYIPALDEQLTAELGSADNFWIAGQTAGQYDNQQINTRDNSVIMPIVILFIFILLLAYLRSIIATIYLVVTVLISFLAALGLGWIILHYGLGVDAIQAAIPLYAFVFLIALGEDYNIFMISGIWKKAKTMPLKQAVKEGVAETGEVISSAGLILAGTFFVLTQVPITILLQFGVITAIGVLLDTFIVRPFLVPALTVVCGKWAFWPSKR